MERDRDLSRVWVVVDMDMFFAAVEMRDEPSLQHVPMAVGSNSMLSTSNYEARKFGVRSAMPGFIAKRLCPSLVLVPPNFRKYAAAAEAARAVFRTYDPNVSTFSLDEAKLDLTAYLAGRGLRMSPHCEGDSGACMSDEVAAVVCELRQRVKEATGGLTCSAGIAANPLLAKIASDMRKPDGQYLVPFESGEICRFIRALPTRKIPGIGKVMEKTLQSLLDVTTVQDVWAEMDRITLVFRERTSAWLHATALGVAPSRREGKTEPRKSISLERTFRDESRKDRLLELGELLARRVAALMQRNHTLAGELGDALRAWRSTARQGARNAITPVAATQGHATGHVANVGQDRDACGGDCSSQSSDEEGGGGKEELEEEEQEEQEEQEQEQEQEEEEAEEEEKVPFRGKSVTVKLKHADFSIRQRTVTLDTPTNDPDEIAVAAKRLIAASYPMTLRLMGVKVHGLVFDDHSVGSQATSLDKFVHREPAASRVDPSRAHSSAAVDATRQKRSETRCVLAEVLAERRRAMRRQRPTSQRQEKGGNGSPRKKARATATKKQQAMLEAFVRRER